MHGTLMSLMKRILSLTIIVLIMFPAITQAAFIRNLQIGDTGLDVKELQTTLNNLGVQVASYGPGSPGNETEYFGSLTHNAVTRFQNLYARDILYPIGLSRGTGYFGFQTRAKISEIMAQPKGILESSVGTDVPVDKALPPVTETVQNEQLTEYIENLQLELESPSFFSEFEGLVEEVRSYFEGLVGDFINDLIDRLISTDGNPFGGQVEEVKKCSCTIGYWVRIGPPVGGDFHFIPTQDYRENNFPTVNTWATGLWWPGGFCFEISGDDCDRLRTKGIIPGFVGSSN